MLPFFDLGLRSPQSVGMNFRDSWHEQAFDLFSGAVIWLKSDGHLGSLAHPPPSNEAPKECRGPASTESRGTICDISPGCQHVVPGARNARFASEMELELRAWEGIPARRCTNLVKKQRLWYVIYHRLGSRRRELERGRDHARLPARRHATLGAARADTLEAGSPGARMTRAAESVVP